MKLDEAIEYAKKSQENMNVMLDETSGRYHCIREFAIEHWKQHYKNIAEIRVVMEVKML